MHKRIMHKRVPNAVENVGKVDTVHRFPQRVDPSLAVSSTISNHICVVRHWEWEARVNGERWNECYLEGILTSGRDHLRYQGIKMRSVVIGHAYLNAEPSCGKEMEHFSWHFHIATDLRCFNY